MLIDFNGRAIVINGDCYDDIYKEIENIKQLNSAEGNKACIWFGGKIKGKKMQGEGKFRRKKFCIIKIEF